MVVLPYTRAAVTIWLRLIERAADHLAIRTINQTGTGGRKPVASAMNSVMAVDATAPPDGDDEHRTVARHRAATPWCERGPGGSIALLAQRGRVVR